MRVLSLCFMCGACGLLLGGLDLAARAWAATCTNISHVYNTGTVACFDNYGYDDYMGVKYRDNSGAGSLLCAVIGTSNNLQSWSAFSSGSDCGNATGSPDGQTTGLLSLKVIHREDPCADADHTTVAAFAGGATCSLGGASAFTFQFGPTFCVCP